MIGLLMVILSYAFGDNGRERFRGLDGGRGDNEQTGISGRIKRALLKSACRRGLVGIARCLIRSGMDINQKSTDGMTALDISVISEQRGCIKLLMESGAEIDVIKHLMKDLDLLPQTSIEYLISLPSCPRAVKIQALELLGAACAVEQLSSHHLARGYWLRSLKERSMAEPRDLVQPKSPQIHPAYGNAREFQTVEDLDTIAWCDADMWMQVLIVRERIHGFTDHFMCSLVQRRAFAYLSSRNFDKCIGLVSHMIDKQPDNPNVSFDEFFQNLPEVMTQNLAVIANLLPVFIKSIDLLEVILTSKMFSEVNYEYLFYGMIFNRFELYIYCIVSAPSPMCEEESRKFHQSVWKLLKIYPRGDLFHRVLIEDFYPHLLYDFVNVLITAGANPGAVDSKGNTPMHLIAKINHPDKRSMIRLLVSNCCHCVFNVRKADRKLFTYHLPIEMQVDLYNKPFDIWQLQCLSAKVLAKSGISYESILPNKLVDFVKLHGTGPVISGQPPCAV